MWISNDFKKIRECVLTSEQIRQIRIQVFELEKELPDSGIPMETASKISQALLLARKSLVEAEILLDEEWHSR